MTCEILAHRYGVETGNDMPSGSIDVRANWLLKQEWGCYIDGNYANAEACDSQHVIVSPSFDTVGVPKTTLTESGFASWVNERGSKCINRLMGNWTDQLPSTTQPQPKVYCSTACLQFDDNCFQCVKGVLENKSNNLQDVCPALYNGTTLTQVDTNLMSQAVACLNCIGSNSANLTKAVEHTDPNTGQVSLGSVYQNPGFDNMWCCMTGDFPMPLSEILGIAFGVLAALLIIFIPVGIVVHRKRNAKQASAKASVEMNRRSP